MMTFFRNSGTRRDPAVSEAARRQRRQQLQIQQQVLGGRVAAKEGKAEAIER